ncbi:MAG: alcohol dehydrogenase [Dehalococcoidia bacterium]|nr:MAG: alcohol dehydrogenase [Dehalococcoidia bacterium]
MQAMVLDQPGQPLTLRTLPDPIPGPGELLLAVSACAVCRTDLQICTGDLAPRRLPIVPGHQAVGHVIACGEGVSGWQVGDRAGVGWLGAVDGTCRFCQQGRENLCPQAQFTGWDRPGGYADRLVVRADFAFPVPADFPDRAAAPLLCAGVIGYRSLKVAGIEPGERLGLFGFGASASLTIQLARAWGCEVFVFTRNPQEQARARALGASWVGSYDDRPPAPLAAAITFAPAGAVVVAALKAVDRGGTVAINAIHLDGIPAFPYQLLWLERSLKSVANFTRQDAREFLELAARLPIRTEVELFPLAAANEALERLAAGQLRGSAVLTIA